MNKNDCPLCGESLSIGGMTLFGDTWYHKTCFRRTTSTATTSIEADRMLKQAEARILGKPHSSVNAEGQVKG